MLTTNAPGPILRDEILEARGRTGFPVDRGQTVRIVDVDGQQVADFVCFRRPDTSEKLSVHNTALIQGTVHISTGHLLLSDRCSTAAGYVPAVHPSLTGPGAAHLPRAATCVDAAYALRPTAFPSPPSTPPADAGAG